MKQEATLKTVRQHIEAIKNPEIKAKCLANLDERCANELCYHVGYALMLGVTQPGHEKDYWQNAYWELRKEDPNYCDNSAFYASQPVQQDDTQSGKKK